VGNGTGWKRDEARWGEIRVRTPLVYPSSGIKDSLDELSFTKRRRRTTGCDIGSCRTRSFLDGQDHTNRPGHGKFVQTEDGGLGGTLLLLQPPRIGRPPDAFHQFGDGAGVLCPDDDSLGIQAGMDFLVYGSDVLR